MGGMAKVEAKDCHFELCWRHHSVADTAVFYYYSGIRYFITYVEYLIITSVFNILFLFRCSTFCY